jgi:hypothetical protein
MRVRDAAVAAGYLAAYTTHHGRNGAGTDMFCLRRMQPKEHDTLATFLWQVITGEKRLPYFRRWPGRIAKDGTS